MLFRTAFLLFCGLMVSEFAQSQITWTKNAGNPVVTVRSSNINDPSYFRYIYGPSVYKSPSSTQDWAYMMWFSSVALGPGTTNNLSLAVSLKGDDWYFYGKNPVLSIGSPGSFDSQWVIDPCVIRVDGVYKVYYTGYNGSVYQGGLATSSDGITWTKYSGNPILPVVPGTWESIVSAAPRVYYDGSTYKMIYTGYDGNAHAIGYATSADGINWTRYSGNPVLTKGSPGTWDQVGVQGSSMFIHNETMFLMYVATGGPVGLATSTNWTSWTKYSVNPVFLPGSPGSWDASLAFGSLSFENNQFKYWYTGIGGSWGYQVGYATSPLTFSSALTQVEESPVKAYSLSESYPNPFNPEATIYYTIPNDQHVNIRVYDILGREVATLVNEMKSTGAYTVTWNANNIASGVYWYKMVAGNYSEMKKMVLTK